jgi:hypothetical protein
MFTWQLIHSLKGLMLEFTFLSFITACLELSFDEYMGKDMIFVKYKMFLQRLYQKKGLYRKLSMILGMCPFCNGLWVAVIFYVLYYKEISLLILLFTGLNYFWIKLLSGIFRNLFKV